MITHTFKNGITTEYKGNRDVKAAWIIVDADGALIKKGYSMTLELAAKAGENEVRLGKPWYKCCKFSHFPDMYRDDRGRMVSRGQATKLNNKWRESVGLTVIAEPLETNEKPEPVEAKKDANEVTSFYNHVENMTYIEIEKTVVSMPYEKAVAIADDLIRKGVTEHRSIRYSRDYYKIMTELWSVVDSIIENEGCPNELSSKLREIEVIWANLTNQA